MGHLIPASWTPCCPEIDEHDLALVLFQVHPIAIHAGHDSVRKRQIDIGNIARLLFGTACKRGDIGAEIANGKHHANDGSDKEGQSFLHNDNPNSCGLSWENSGCESL